jgi:hypothetical protein
MKGRAPAVFSKKKNREERERERDTSHIQTRTHCC